MTALPRLALWLPLALTLGLPRPAAAQAATPPAASLTHTCPAQVRLSQATVAVNPPAPGFTPLVSDLPLPLTGASAFDGPPEEGAVLKPAAEQRGAAGRSTVWRFEGRFEAGKWLSCDYAQGLVRLAVAVDAASTRCEALTAATPGPGPARTTVKLACR
jgi:hypothetical protein